MLALPGGGADMDDGGADTIPSPGLGALPSSLSGVRLATPAVVEPVLPCLVPLDTGFHVAGTALLPSLAVALAASTGQSSVLVVCDCGLDMMLHHDTKSGQRMRVKRRLAVVLVDGVPYVNARDAVR